MILPTGYHNKTGIYVIIAGDKEYVGSASLSLATRWSTHRNHLRNNKHHSPRLQNWVNKYGIENLRIEVLELVEPDKCIEREQYYINTRKPFFNISPTAGSNRGVTKSRKQKDNLSKARSNFTEEQVIDILTRYTNKESVKKIAQDYTVSYVQIHGIALKDTLFYEIKQKIKFNKNLRYQDDWDIITWCLKADMANVKRKVITETIGQCYSWFLSVVSRARAFHKIKKELGWKKVNEYQKRAVNTAAWHALLEEAPRIAALQPILWKKPAPPTS